MLRKLASIQRVLSLDPIDGADRIELARINGWQCVVKKGEFKVGDLGVYFEIDAVPVDNPSYSWLWQRTTGARIRIGDEVTQGLDSILGKVIYVDGGLEPKEAEVVWGGAEGDGQSSVVATEFLRIVRPGNFRIRTKKLKGVVSQGLLMPLEAVLNDLNGNSLEEDTDVTESLGVTKYEPPEFNGRGGFKAGRRVSNFPTRIVPKTDEQRIQSATKVLWELAGKPWVATLKLDGTSFTAAYDAEQQKVLVCSRNFVVDATEEMKSLYVDIANKYGLLEKLAEPGFQDLAVQGEIVGPGIQGNKLGLAEPELRLFRIFNTSTRRPVTQRELEKYARALGVSCAEVIAEGDCFAPIICNFVPNLDEPDEEVAIKGRITTIVIKELLDLAEGKYPGTKNEREGLVIRPRDEVLYSAKLGDWLSFKIINNKFLLAEKD